MNAGSDVVEPLGDGLFLIDTGFHRERFDAAWLIVEQGRGAFVDSGTNASVPRLLAALDVAGIDRAAVDYAIATHVHLDHAGGIGLLMRSLPNARAVVHPRGARHLIDPVHLVAGATAVYGEDEMARTYGTIEPIDAGRVVQPRDGETLLLGGRPLLFLDTPGHAMHHHCILDARTGGFFTGDTFGLSYREFDTGQGVFAMPTTTPVQFQPEALKRSIERLLAHEPRWMYLTHYGRVGGSVDAVRRLAAQLVEQLDAIVALARSLPPGLRGAARHAELRRGILAVHLASLRAHGVVRPDAEIARLLELDVELNAQGVAVWLDRIAPAPAPAPLAA